LKEYKINTINLNGKRASLSFRIKGEKGEWKMAPPIVEVSKIDKGKPVLIDGEHRFVLAKELNRKVRVIWISNLSSKYPRVAKPVTWEEVKEYRVVPGFSQKRDYRFPKLNKFPDISSFSEVKVTEDNFRYFFYRDLSPICTTKVRPIKDQ